MVIARGAHRQTPRERTVELWGVHPDDGQSWGAHMGVVVMRILRVGSAVLAVCLAGSIGGMPGPRTPAVAGPPQLTITGVVAGGHGNVASGSVSFYTDCGGSGPVEFAMIRSGVFTATVPAGQYRVRVQGETVSWHDAQPTCETASVVTLSSDTYLVLRAIPLFTLTGTVATVRGPVSWGSVRFYTDCTEAEVPSASITNGSFAAKLTPGVYRVRIVPGQRVFSARESWHNGKPDCATADTVTVAGDQTTALRAIATQRVSLRQPKTVRGGSTVRLPAKTKQGVRVTWSARPKKVCSLRDKNRLVTRKAGSCRLRASAAAGPGIAAYAGLFTINVYTPRGES